MFNSETWHVELSDLAKKILLVLSAFAKKNNF